MHDSIKEAIGSELFDVLYPPAGDWRVRQEHDVRAVCRDNQAWVAELHEELIGFVAIDVNREDPLGEITMVAVDPEHQCHGAGTALTRWAIDKIRRAGKPVPWWARAPTQVMLQRDVRTRTQDSCWFQWPDTSSR